MSSAMRLGLRLNVASFSARPCSHLRTRMLSTSTSQLCRPNALSSSLRRPTPKLIHGHRALSLWPWSSKPPTPPTPVADPESPEAFASASVPEPPTVFEEVVDPLVSSEALEPSTIDASASLEAPAPEAASTASDASTSAVDNAIYTGDTALPTTEIALPDGVFDALTPDALIPAALQYGDLAALGLTGWTPAGLVRWIIEIFHTTTGLPWFWTIVGSVVLVRVLLFPLAVMQLRNTARLQPIQPQMLALRAESAEAQRTQDKLRLQRVMLKTQALYRGAGVSMFQMMGAPIANVAMQLGLFFGVRKLCDLPLEQLKHSGVDWLPDLTIADPTQIAPIVATALMQISISVSARDAVITNPMQLHMFNGFRFLTLVGYWFLMQFPAGLTVSIGTGVLCLTLQTLILRLAPVRHALGIPLVDRSKQPNLPSMLSTARALPSMAREWVSSTAEAGQRKEARNKYRGKK